MTEPIESFNDVTQAREEIGAILVVQEDILSRVATRGHMIDGSFVLDSQWTCHMASLARIDARYKV